MKDGIIKENGTSRLMRATLPATYEELRAAAAAGTQLLDILFNPDGWSQLPDFLNKANLYSDETAAKFGFGDGSVPNNALSLLGKYNQHWWKEYKPHYELVLTDQKVSDETGASDSPLLWAILRAYSTQSTNTFPIQYSGELNIASDGSVSLKNPQTLQLSYNTYGSASVLLGKYYHPVLDGNKSESIHYAYPSQTIKQYGGGQLAVYVNKIAVVSSRLNSDGYTYVQSNNRNEYPDNGPQGDGEYEYLGVPFSRLPAAPIIESGAYVGTGTKGSNNQNQLKFSGKAQVVFIAQQGRGQIADSDFSGLFINGSSRGQIFASRADDVAGYVRGVTITWEDDNSIKWYNSNNAKNQLNESGETYFYFAFLQ